MDAAADATAAAALLDLALFYGTTYIIIWRSMFGWRVHSPRASEKGRVSHLKNAPACASAGVTKYSFYHFSYTDEDWPF